MKRQSESYRDKLKGATKHKYFEAWLTHLYKTPISLEDFSKTQQNSKIPYVDVTKVEVQSFSSSLDKALIINTVEITRSIVVIQKHLKGIWRIQNPIDVHDVGKGYYVLFMNSIADYLIALFGGPCFLFDLYLAIQKWRPWFLPFQGLLDSKSIWVRLHDLPLELYDPKALYKIGMALESQLKNGHLHGFHGKN